jgi:cysteine desulfurase
MDYNATTPIRPEVKSLMCETLDLYANASSMHEAGRAAYAKIAASRNEIASLIGAKDPDEIVFTSGGSESNNTVFMTVPRLRKERGRSGVVTTAIEHPCVLNSARYLESEGYPAVFVGVDSKGRVHLGELEAAITNDTALVSVMAANNEIGTVENVRACADLAHAKGALFHTDATQAVGKIPVDVSEWGCDYLTLSCHKLYGPKGVGALWIKKGAPIEPLIRGGHQERGVRAGTYNNVGIYGFGEAARLARLELADYGSRTWRLRERLRDGIVRAIPAVRINGDPASVLPNTLNVSFPGAEGESILLYLDLEGIRVSTGSACASGSLDPSHVLLATGLGPELAHGSIRFSLGRDTQDADVDYVLEKLPGIIARLRRMSTVSIDEWKDKLE